MPRSVQAVSATIAACVLLLVANGIYHVARKPSELFFPLSGRLDKTPSETWHSYASLFRRHSTAIVTPELLAALAQVEGSGNPIARTDWRWSLSANPFAIYRPVSSAVGMYQLTDGTFLEARRYCIHDHEVVEQGPWHDLGSCWFNAFYTRVVPGHAVELTSAYLHHRVVGTLSRRRIARARLEQKQDLAAVIHLCGASAGERYAARGFRFRDGQRCGNHDPRLYLDRVRKLKDEFARLARTG